MATTTITGTINGVNNAALAGKWITFRLVQLGTDSGATATVAQSVDSVQTDANGDFSVGIWNNGDSGKPSVLEITIDGSKPESVIIPTGTVSIELWDLIENYQADGSTSEQVPVVSELFLRKSTNLSDLGSASTSRTNLGVAIGADVQAYSATLAATTASFTVAEESKLSGLDALAEVNDPTTLLDADINFTVQAHSAILDATTASFTTAKDTAISTNTANIASNVTDIATNVTNIATNVTNIATNVTDIATNVTNIALKSPIDNPTFTGTINTSATGIDFNPGVAGNGGELSWNNTEKTLDLATGSDSVTLQLGQEVVLYVRNTTGATLSDGQVVTISGSQGNKPTVALAQADTVENARKTIGVVTQTILNNSDGFVTLIGKVRGLVLDIGTYTEGDVVYLSSTVAGGLTVVEPDIAVEVGHVLATSTGGSTSGVLEVQVHNGAAIHELEQVVVANTAAIALNTAKVTNSTHTGDVTGDTALTISAGAVDLGMLSAGGSPSSTTFLRGDNIWAPVNATGGGDVATDGIWDAKGDLAGGTGINTATRLAVGTDTQVLTADSAAATGMKWAAPFAIITVEYPYTTDFQSGVSQTRDLSGILTVASGGYQGNANLTSLYIGSKITEIGFDAVQSSANLLDVTIPNSVTVIGDSSFLSCTGLTSIIIPDSVLDIQGSAFASCTGLTSVTIGENVSQIQYGAFSSCSNVGFTEFIVPNSVQTIENNVFEFCAGLTSVTLPVNASFTLLDAYTFRDCTALPSIVIPDSVTTIGEGVFFNCTGLTSIVIHDGVTSLGLGAFKNCTSLGSISCLNSVAPTLGTDVFFNVLATTIDVPIGATGYGATYGGLTVNYV